MRVLVTGASGFVGTHLTGALAAGGHAVIAPPVDVRDAVAVRQAVHDAAPEAIVHLAAQAFVPQALAQPLETVDVNVGGTAHVLEAAREGRARVLVVSSAEVYGRQLPERMPLDERAPLAPANPYAASKAAAEALALGWHRAYGLDVVVARPFNHIGPGQDRRFAIASFAAQLAAIAAGGVPVLQVGNLASQRDFLDVRDVAAAYLALLANARAGEVYNVCSGRATAIREVLRELIAVARVAVEVREDPERVRPADVPLVVGDPAKLQAATGWAPAIPLRASLADLYADALRRAEARA